MPRSCVLSSADKTAIRRRYKDGDQTTVIAKDFGVSISAITYYGRMTGVKRRGFLSKADKKAICKRYIAGESGNTIAVSFKTSGVTICSVLKSASVVIRGPEQARRIYTINERSLDDNSPDRNYWCGFILADGSVGGGPRQNVFEITLSECDKRHLERLKAFLGSNQPLYSKPPMVIVSNGKTYTTKPFLRLQITSTGICESLAKLGVVKNKTFRTDAGRFAFDRDFWRGVVDGDGEVTLRKSGKQQGYPQIGLVGSRKIVEQFVTFAKSVCDPMRIEARPAQNIYATRVNGRNALILAKVLYGDCHVALDRKLKSANAMIARL